jgi:prolyl 4-hydroxylase
MGRWFATGPFFGRTIMAEGTVARADQLLAQGQTRQAIDLVTAAAARGDADALFREAVWKLAGQPIARDLTGARRSLRSAAAIGHQEAALMEAALAANGSGATADWTSAIQLLSRTAHPAAVEQINLLAAMTLHADGTPAEALATRTIATQPNIRHVSRLFSPAECLHVAQAAADLLRPAVVVDPRTGANVANSVRTSDGAVIGPTRESPVIRALNQRIAAVTGTDVAQGEALAVLRYRPGQEFRPHLDSIEGVRNQRIKTVLIYLNDGFTGGATYFAAGDVRITPRTGDAVIFDNVRQDGTIDPLSRHAGEPVRSGIKWLATRWIRARPFDVWTGPEAA